MVFVCVGAWCGIVDVRCLMHVSGCVVVFGLVGVVCVSVVVVCVCCCVRVCIGLCFVVCVGL